MIHSHKILVYSILGIVLVLLLIAISLSLKIDSSQKSIATIPLVTTGRSSSSSFSVGNAFAPQRVSDILPIEEDGGIPVNSVNSKGSSTSSVSLNDVAKIVASANASSVTSQPAKTSTLAIPAVSDDDIAIDPSGVSTVIDYLSYFSKHSSEIAFNGLRFKTVLKDKNGVTLPITGLIKKAITDNNFKEISNSLAVQKDFTAAEIIFLKSIKVTNDAVALDKQAIGTEELTLDLANKALDVASGTLSLADFENYNLQFSAVVATAHQNLVAQSGVLSLGKQKDISIADRILHFFGLETLAVAQTTNTPFGGQVITIVPCDCDVGDWVTIGSPVPASLFVSYAFLSSPLFFPEYAYYEGAWWLGLYLSTPMIPCNSEIAECGPIGFGGEIIMVGTSL